jgi:aspartyl/glutamyl-tRNA(Asn/Gln) amidotransferase C subunit
MEDKDFDRLLKTCRLRLSEEDNKKIKSDIDNILEYFNTIESVECSKYSPSYQAIDIPSNKRSDNVEPFPNTDQILKNSKIYRFYVVGPKI